MSEILIRIEAWDGSSAETDLGAALATARYLWDEAVATPGRPIVNFYVDNELVQTVSNRKELDG